MSSRNETYHPSTKGSRTKRVRKYTTKRRSFVGNQHKHDGKSEKEFVSASARKLNANTDFQDVAFDSRFEYVILAFSAVFSHLENVLKCKTCDGNIKFLRKSAMGLGFQLVITCSCKDSSSVDSCKREHRTYEINRRMVLVMRLLGVGLSGLNLFCAMMDLTGNFSNYLYYSAVDNIHSASKSLSESIFKKAAIEEKSENVKNGLLEDELLVSGDGSWAKRGFTSLISICSLIGKYTGKILDCFISSKTCKSCEVNRKSMDPTEFLIWQETEHAEDCTVNYDGSSGGMEVQGVVEMFSRSENLHNVKYAYYIGDGDSKTFTNLLDAQPYKDFIIEKLECVLHVGKRMFRRLKEVKKTLTEIKKMKKKEENKKKAEEKNEEVEKPLPAKRGRRSKNDPPVEKPVKAPKTVDLTGKIMKEMSLFYSLAIQNNPDDLQAMKNAIWAGYYHRISTDENPQHQFCDKSWCKYLKSLDEGTTPAPHKPALSDLVQEYVKSVFEDLTNDELLTRCLGKNTQNNNECFNSTVWSLVPKHLFSGKKIVELSTWICACIFNEGSISLLKFFEIMGLEIGPHSYKYACDRDEARIKCGEKRCTDQSKQARMDRKKAAAEREELYEQAYGLLYGPGMAD